MDGDDESDVSAASKEFVDVGDDMEINKMCSYEYMKSVKTCCHIKT